MITCAFPIFAFDKRHKKHKIKIKSSIQNRITDIAYTANSFMQDLKISLLTHEQ